MVLFITAPGVPRDWLVTRENDRLESCWESTAFELCCQTARFQPVASDTHTHKDQGTVQIKRQKIGDKNNWRNLINQLENNEIRQESYLHNINIYFCIFVYRCNLCNQSIVSSIFFFFFSSISFLLHTFCPNAHRIKSTRNPVQHTPRFIQQLHASEGRNQCKTTNMGEK